MTLNRQKLSPTDKRRDYVKPQTSRTFDAAQACQKRDFAIKHMISSSRARESESKPNRSPRYL